MQKKSCVVDVILVFRVPHGAVCLLILAAGLSSTLMPGNIKHMHLLCTPAGIDVALVNLPNQTP